MTITLVTVKGAPLSIPEFDGNFLDLDGRLQFFETGTGQPAPGIVNITSAGNVLTFHFSDASTMSVTIPPALLVFRDEWQPDTFYNPMDIVVGPQGSPYSRNRYLVIFPHTSVGNTAGDFDPNEATGGNDFYALLMPSELSRTKVVSTNTFDPTLLDAQAYVRCTHVSGCLVTVPDDGTVAFDIDTELFFKQVNAGPVSFVGESTAVSIDWPDDQNPTTAIRGAVCQLKKVGPNQWDLFGRLQITT